MKYICYTLCSFLLVFSLQIANAQDDNTTVVPASGTDNAPAGGTDAAPAGGSASEIKPPDLQPHHPAFLPPSTMPKDFHKPSMPRKQMEAPAPTEEVVAAPIKEKKKLKIDWSKLGDYIDGLIGVVVSAGFVAVIAIPAAIVAVTQFK